MLMLRDRSTRIVPALAHLGCSALLLVGGCAADGAADTDLGASGSSEVSSGTSPEPTSAASTSDATATPGTTTTSTDAPSSGETTATSGEASDADSGTTSGALSEDPDLPGDHTWTSATTEIVVEGQALPTTVYVPDGDGPFPVLAFVHGFQLTPANYASYGAHFASWGYVVVMPELPGAPFDAPTYVESRDWFIGVLDWIEGEGNAASGPLAGRADVSLLAVGGHSRGGKVALLTAVSDPRPSVVLGIDPIDTYGGPGASASPQNPSVTPELMPMIDARLMLIGETTNAVAGSFGSACAPAENNFAQYFMHATSPAMELEFVGANHMSFLDSPNCGLPCAACPAGTDVPSMTLLMTRGYGVAFLQAYLLQEAAFEPWLVGDPMQADVDAGLVITNTANGF